MRKKFILIILIFISGIPGLFAQKFSEFSEDSEKFLSQLNDLFSQVNIKEDKNTCEEMMEQFTTYWNTGVFNKEIKERIKATCNLMLKRRMRAYPDFYNYLSSNMGLMDFDHSAESYEAWDKSIDMLVNDKRSSKPIKSFLETSYNLLYKNILYESRATSWKSSTYEFEFGFDSVPVVTFNDLDLTCRAYSDSSVIFHTKGVFYPIDNYWKGETGVVNWVRAGYDPNVVYAELGKYELSLSFSRYSADSVKFYHKDYWTRPMLGSLEEKVLANVTEERASYPQFKSYDTQVEIKSVYKDVDYLGGIEVRGRKLIGIGLEGNMASLTFKKDNKEFVKVMSDNYIIYPDRVSAAFATATIRFDKDSIFHPGLKLNYNNENRELSLIRTGEGNSKSPFYDSFHNLDIYTEAIYWKMDEPYPEF